MTTIIVIFVCDPDIQVLGLGMTLIVIPNVVRNLFKGNYEAHFVHFVIPVGEASQRLKPQTGFASLGVSFFQPSPKQASVGL
jgi:hypothetical protein